MVMVRSDLDESFPPHFRGLAVGLQLLGRGGGIFAGSLCLLQRNAEAFL